MEENKAKIYHNGKIFTSDIDNISADAMVVEDGIIKWIGSEADMPSNYGSLEKYDLQGQRVIPGFVDAHMHAIMLASVCQQISCLPPKVNSLEELAAEIKKVRATQKEGEWIQGWGYDEGKLAEKRSPNRHDLDKGCSDSPVLILRTCAHIACVNSKVLEMAGITKDTPDPEGGEIERDENGEPTGVLKETARMMVTDLMPDATREKIVSELLTLGKILSSQGITATTDMGNFGNVDNYGDYEEAVKQGFKQRIAMYYMWDNFVGDDNFDIPKERLERDQQIRVGGLKIIGDGSVSGRTAWMTKPYLGSDDYGISVCTDEIMESAIETSKKFHCQLSMHAMGGRAIDRVVNRAYEEEKWTLDDVPCLRVEHITEPTENAIKKVVERGYYFVTQPIFLYAEIESYLKNLGKDQLPYCYPMKTMLEKGVNLAFSTDAPATAWATPSDPFACIKGAVTRVAYDGTDCGQGERVDAATAVRLYTAESAKAAGFYKIGMLKEGYYADFVILDKDIINIEPEKIDTIKVVKTYLNGEEIFS